MRGLTGLTLVLAGAAAAVYGYYPEAADRKDAFDRALAWYDSEPSKPSTRSSELPLVVVDPQRRAFSPQAPLFQQVPRGDASAHNASQPVTAAGSSSAAARGLAGSQATHNPSASPVTTVAVDARADASVTDLTALPSATSPVRTVATPIAAGKTGGEEAQRDLTRNLQKELKRVGCYDGEITGSWTAASRRAMKSFTERVNATLPIDEPDYILLTLVQGHGAEACGARCPADQIMAKDGKCQPRAIVAQAEKKAIKRAAAKAPEPKSAEVGRAMEMWAKVSTDTTGSLATKPVKSDGWKTAVVVAEPPPAVTPVSPPAAVVAPLPGRMSIGGPGTAPPSVTTSSIAAVEPPAAVAGKAAVAGRRIPHHVVNGDRPRPRRARSYDGGIGYAPKPVQTSSKASRVRSMHYNLFSRPDRTTN